MSAAVAAAAQRRAAASCRLAIINATAHSQKSCQKHNALAACNALANQAKVRAAAGVQGHRNQGCVVGSSQSYKTTAAAAGANSA